MCVCLSVRDTTGETGIHGQLLGRLCLSPAVCCTCVYLFPTNGPSSSSARGEQDRGFACFLPMSFPAPYTRGSTIPWVILPLPCTLTDHEGKLSRKGGSYSHCCEPSTKMSHINCPEHKMFPGSSGFHLFSTKAPSP